MKNLKNILLATSLILISCTTEIEENPEPQEYQEPQNNLSQPEQMLVGQWGNEERNLVLATEKINKTWALEGKELYLKNGNKIDTYKLIKIDSTSLILEKENARLEFFKE